MIKISELHHCEHARNARHAWGSRSDDQRAVQIGGWLGADVFYLPLPVRAKEIIAQTVALRVDDCIQPGTQPGPLRGVKLDLEDRELNALAPILAGAGDAA